MSAKYTTVMSSVEYLTLAPLCLCLYLFVMSQLIIAPARMFGLSRRSVDMLILKHSHANTFYIFSHICHLENSLTLFDI